ncbi:MAG: hypothetical protein AB7F74_05885 [Parvibaculaceae bacterium]
MRGLVANCETALAAGALPADFRHGKNEAKMVAQFAHEAADRTHPLGRGLKALPSNYRLPGYPRVSDERHGGI